jgi:excisionase family DNA binding protein
MDIKDISTHPKAFVTLEAFADYLEVSPRTLYHNIDKGALKAVKVGGLLRIPIEEARKYCSVPARPDLSTGNGNGSGPSHLV